MANALAAKPPNQKQPEEDQTRTFTHAAMVVLGEAHKFQKAQANWGR